MGRVYRHPGNSKTVRNKQPLNIYISETVRVQVLPGSTCVDVNICKDHRDKVEIPDPLAVESAVS